MFCRETGMKDDDDDVEARDGAWSMETAMVSGGRLSSCAMSDGREPRVPYRGCNSLGTLSGRGNAGEQTKKSEEQRRSCNCNNCEFAPTRQEALL